MVKRTITRTPSHEFVNGIQVMAYLEDVDTPFGVMERSSYHWSTPGAGAKNVRRMFTEDQLFAAVEAAQAEMLAKVTRLDVIDHRARTAPDRCRPVNAYGCRVELVLQDEDRTLKVFINDGPEETPCPECTPAPIEFQNLKGANDG